MLPSAIQSEIDRWLEHRGWSPQAWQSTPVIGRGRSLAQVWRLGPRANENDNHSSRPNDSVSGLGFAIRNWGRSIEHRPSIESILFFQQAACRGCVDSVFSRAASASELGPPSIVPDVLRWTDRSWCREHASTLWTIETWRPGRPLDTQEPVSDGLLQQAWATLDRLHTVGRRLGVRQIAPPGLVERADRLARWTSPVWRSRWRETLSQNEKGFPPSLAFDRYHPILERAVDHLYRYAPELGKELQRWLAGPLACHWLVRDLWRENILVEREQITGVIDFGASRIDWPVLEIVRCLSSWTSPADERIPQYLEGNSLLSAEHYRFFDHVATLLSLLQWFEWSIADNLSIEQHGPQTQARIEELDRRLADFE